MSPVLEVPGAPLVIDHGVGPVHIERSGPLGALLAWVAGLPAGERCDVTFRVEAGGADLRWCRRYQAARCERSADTTVRATATGFVERRGPVALQFALTGPGQAALSSVRFLGVPLPRHMLSSRIESVRTDNGLRTTVTIAIGRGALGRLRYTADLVEVPEMAEVPR